MDAREKKDYLRRYKAADSEINDLLRQREAIMARLTRVTTSYSGMPGGGGGDIMTDGVAKLIEVEQEINDRIDALIALRREIEGCIRAVDSSAQRRVLRLRYIEGMTWERVALEMHYERTQVWRLHGRALAALKME
nr:MAG TPA_asm: Protein of unknown function (DUF722) [Caudoviricetes sp.]